jgi:high affinity sulfate transporter 1
MTPSGRGDTTHGLARYLPIARWLPAYDRAWLTPDVLAAVTVAAFTVPESMAYASLAGLPPQAGLYASLAAPLLYALFGTSRQLAIGPTSAVAILVASTIGGLAGGDAARYAGLAALMAMLVGLISLLAWLLRLGFLVNFISESVLTGFSCGAALYIASTQLGKLFGIEGDEGGFFDRVFYIASHLGETNLASLAVGLGGLVVLVVGERFSRRLPWSLIVVVVSIVLVSVSGLAARGVAITGEIPRGLPVPAIPSFGAGDVQELLPGALAVFLLAYVEGMGVVRTFAKRHDYRSDADQELLALGASNLGAGLFQSFAVGGSLSRSAVNDESGAKTPLAGLIGGVLVGVVALFLTGLFYNLPEPILAAIVLVAVRGLFDVSALRRLYRVSRDEFAVAMVALGGVLLFGMLEGILLAVVVALLMLIGRASRPHTAVLGRIRGTDQFGDIARHPENEQLPGVLVFRVEGAMFFANTLVVHDAILAKIDLEQTPVRLVVLDLSSTPYLDLSAMESIRELDGELAKREIDLRLAETTGAVRDALRKDGLDTLLGPLRPGVTVAEVIEHWQSRSRQESGGNDT